MSSNRNNLDGGKGRAYLLYVGASHSQLGKSQTSREGTPPSYHSEWDQLLSQFSYNDRFSFPNPFIMKSKRPKPW